MKRYRHLYQVEFDSDLSVDFSKVLTDLLRERAMDAVNNIDVLQIEIADRESK